MSLVVKKREEEAQVVAIVNSYNRLSLLQLALPSLVAALQGISRPSAVVIYEAGSTDGSLEWLAQYCSQIEDSAIHVVSPAGDDTSFSAGVNTACAYAADHFPRLQYYFLFETDNWISASKPLQDAIDLLETVSDLGAAGFTVQSHAGTFVCYGCRFPKVAEFIMGQQVTGYLRLDAPNNTKWQNIGDLEWRLCDVVFTSPLLVRQDAWDRTGGLDAAAFPFSDCDLDWAWRLNKAGWKMAVLKVEGVVHDNKQNLSEWSATRVITYHRARYRLLRRHRGKWIAALKPLLVSRHIVEFLFIWLTARGSKNYTASLGKRRTLLRTVLRSYEI